MGRSGPEAFFRQYLGIEGRHKESKNPFHKGSLGAKPIDFIASLPERDVNVLWEFNPGQRTIHELTQIVLINKEGESKPLRIQDRWLKDPRQFRKYIKDLNFADKFDAIVLAGDEDDSQKLERLIRELKGDIPDSFEWDTPGPSTVLGSTIKFSVTDAYFRAVAKCAFHYLLAVNQNVQGSEMAFKDIRTFIMRGGEYEKFVIQKRIPILSYPKNHRPDSYLHVLVVEWNATGHVEGRVQFFIGPDYEPLTYRIPLGKNVITLMGKRVIGHAFRYFPDATRGKYHGEAIPLTTTPPIYHVY